LAVAKTPPFPLNEEREVEEQLRLRYRYLDLRRPQLQHNLRQRSKFIAAIRQALIEQGFIDIETPQLIRATPEGARDYLVPSRLLPGSFYALPQSPQLYKQLCMVAGLDRYFQIARCMRDEDLRADRQPEFTQLDVEMSFVTEEDIFAVIESTIAAAWTAANFRDAPLNLPFARITWRDSMQRFGVDKPDMRFALELQDLSDIVRHSGFQVFAQAVSEGKVVKGICVKQGCDLSRRDIEGGLTEIIRQNRGRGLAYLFRQADGWQGSIAKFFTPEELEAIGQRLQAQVGDAILMVADRALVVNASLGALRNHLGRTRQLYDVNTIYPVWVTQFPMFEQDDLTGNISPAHHPFTMMEADDLPLLETNPLAIRARAYDLVINGREIGSGSIRITDRGIQERVFAVLGIDKESARQRFGFLLEAFEYGVPPHGGFAPGIDRLVMEGLGEENIRDVIAFPKNQQAQELMTDAPAPVEEAQLRDLSIKIIDRQK